jgi:electron transport complex protein RnfB
MNIEAAPEAELIDALLPQTQCTRCGYPACRPYAEAIAGGSAEINQCPPGGAATIASLARLLNRPEIPLNPQNGIETAPTVAWIDEARCIGCARCLPPCPVDAILGAAKFTHTILVDRCTGCELCMAPCPVDCIEMRPFPKEATVPPKELNRQRHEQHVARQLGRVRNRQLALDAKKAGAPNGGAAC